MKSALAFFDAHRVVPVVDTTVGLDDVPAGLARLASGEAFGKVCYVVVA